MNDQSDTTLLILGHGSSKHPESSASVRMHAELLRESGDFSDVRVAFLKEDPLIDDCLGGIESANVVIVPDFLAEGYFTRQVIPAKLRLADRGGNIRYCPPVGTHPVMAELLADAAEVARGDWSPAHTSLLVVGHGSKKSPCSKQTMLHHLRQLRARSGYAQIADLWLEEAPRVAQWQAVATQSQVLVLPYLLNDGQHGGWDIPSDLGVINDKSVHGVTHTMGELALRIAPALGTSPRMSEAIRDMARV